MSKAQLFGATLSAMSLIISRVTANFVFKTSVNQSINQVLFQTETSVVKLNR